MVRVGNQNINLIYAGNTRICSAYIGGELVFSGGCPPEPMPYKWIPDPASALCEQEENEVTEISNLKSPHAIKLRKDGAFVFIFDYYQGYVYRVNLQGLKTASDKRAFIYSSPAVSVTPVSGATGGGMEYDSLTDRIYAYTSFSTAHVINGATMTLIRTITLIGLSSGTNERSKPSISQIDREFWGYGNGGFVRISILTNTIESGWTPTPGTIYAMSYNNEGVILKDASSRMVTKHNKTTGASLDSLNLTTLNPVWRGFYADEPAAGIFFVDNPTSGNGSSLCRLNIGGALSLSFRVALPDLGASVSVKGANAIIFFPVNGLLYICGHINNQFTVWRFTKSGTFVSGFTNPLYSGVIDGVYDPSSNRIMTLVRGNVGNDTDGAIIYVT